MQGLDLLDENDGDTVFRDVIMLALAGFVAIVVILLPHLNPPVRATDSAPPPGNLIVEARWPDELDTDVDLWVEAPGDVPVGYSNKGGVVFNLLRDDLCHEADVTNLNYEVSYSRGLPAGRYTINAHLYAHKGAVTPIPVTIVISLKKTVEQASTPILVKQIELRHVGEELTVFRFELSDSGDLVPGSVHDLQRSLRGRTG